MNTPDSALLGGMVGVLLGLALAGLFALVRISHARAEKEQSNELPEGLRSTLGALDDASCVVENSGIVVAVSPFATDYRIESGVVLPSERLRQLARSARDSGEPTTVTLRLKRTDSNEVLVAARATRVTPRLVVLMLRDISEGERLEQTRADFVANTGHELKTPIGAITLLAEATVSAADDPEQVRRFAGRIHAEADRLAQLSRRIMNLSELQSADALAGASPVRIAGLIDRVIENHQTAADSAGVALIRGAIADVRVLGNAEILADAIGNLLANAIAYSPAGSRVVVATKLVADSVEISVTDDGIGIHEADHERIFERFYRADEARSRATGGSGLGLSIVKHAAMRHGGSVRVWSVPGVGSTFVITLPLYSAAGSPGSGKSQKKKKAQKAKKAADAAAEGAQS